MLRTLAVEEAVANSPNSQTGEKWKPRYPVEAKAELEREKPFRRKRRRRGRERSRERN